MTRFTDPHTYRNVSPTNPPKQIAKTIRQHDNPSLALLEYMDRCTEEHDLVAAITGPEGSTKSTCAEHFSRILEGDNFNPANIATQAKYFLQRIRDVDRRTAVVFDEAGEGMHNRDSMGIYNKTINEVLMQARVRHLWIFLCFPRFESMDLYPRQFRTRLWIRCQRPGLAEVRLRDWDKPMGPDRKDALNAFIPVIKIKYPRIGDKDGYWEKRETQKEDRLKGKISKFLNEAEA